ncbi:MAG: tripartite tricarboxylate transporter TctB family protein [Geminicoccaceae bacterium]
MMLLVAVVYWFEADKIRISPLDGPVGASGLPKTLAYALAVLAAILIVRSLAGALTGAKTVRTQAEDDSDRSLVDILMPHLRAVGLLAIGVGYLLLVSWFGYAITIAALLLVVSLYIGATLSLRTLVIAAIGGVVCHVLFVEFLGIPLPAGKILEPLLGAT